MTLRSNGCSRDFPLAGACFSPPSEGGGGGDPKRTLLEAFNALPQDEQTEVLEVLKQILGKRKGSGSSPGGQEPSGEDNGDG
ncbi:hypothetical protein [Roseibium sp.]|uniref:hypothetical protein n=1 Tax=Roseibium sp. TaxID=1936156 RepID=UPI003A973808